MGFGILFIGYFLILNLTYYSITDVIAAAVMLLGLYKLSSVNRYFKTTAICTGVFLAFSIGEIGVAIYELFEKKINSPMFISYMSMARCLIIGVLTVMMLKAIEEVAREVEITELPKKCKKLMLASFIIYSLWILLEMPISFINDYVLAVASLLTVIAVFILIILNLTVIYTCYMKICMPGDEDVMKDKPSRFAFVNEYRARKEEQNRKEAEENLKRVKEKLEKKGRKK